MSSSPAEIEPMIPKATIFSVFMDNVDPDVVKYQRKCIEHFIPELWDYWQVNVTGETHPAAINKVLSRVKSDVVLILDVDCIPLSRSALVTLFNSANSGILTGAIQRANHIENNNHLYVSPFCMAFSKNQYAKLGSPNFSETKRGDVGEELTYAWEAAKEKVSFLWPNSINDPVWYLTPRQMFGYGTTYGSMFYHQFCSREKSGTQAFVNKCKQFIQ